MIPQSIIALVSQITTILLGLFGAIISFVRIIENYRLFEIMVIAILVLFLCVLLIISEIYVFSIFRYFDFICKIWGKAIIFFLIGILLFGKYGIWLAQAIIFWIFAIVYLILNFVLRHSPLPLLQRKNPPIVSANNDEYFVRAEMIN